VARTVIVRGRYAEPLSYDNKAEQFNWEDIGCNALAPPRAIARHRASSLRQTSWPTPLRHEGREAREGHEAFFTFGERRESLAAS
jgi:hypothetical protein